MAEYINKKAMLEQIARRELQMTGDKRISIDALREFIKNRPVIEIRHGHWVCRGDGSYGNNQLYCSVCKKYSGISGPITDQAKPYCPNCGATLDERMVFENGRG